MMLIWYGFTLDANANQETYQVILTSYTCETGSHNPMYPCGQPRWGGNAYGPGLACPVAWRNRRFELPGYGTFRCDDTPLNESLYGLPHVDLRVPTVYEARQIGIRRLTIYDANTTPTKTLTQENNSSSTVYIVLPGDTLSNIAEEYGTTINIIRSHNNLTSNTIRIGQRLQIPQSSSIANTTTTSATTATTATATNITVNSVGVHVVVPGDTLSGIAAKYNTTVDTIRTSNQLPGYIIRIGDELQVSERNNSVSEANNTVFGTISTVNNTRSNTEPNVESSIESNSESNTRTHTVKQGESLSAIARQYNVSYISILEANNLPRPNLIQPGQKLIIPLP